VDPVRQRHKKRERIPGPINGRARWAGTNDDANAFLCDAIRLHRGIYADPAGCFAREECFVLWLLSEGTARTMKRTAVMMLLMAVVPTAAAAADPMKAVAAPQEPLL
jgi:hypothetical protein